MDDVARTRQTPSCVYLEMSPGANGKYSTCAKFCESSCFGQCTPGANCPQNRNGTCKETGLPDLSQGACCQKARMTNGISIGCDKPFTPEQIELLTASDDERRPKVGVECCCSPHTCTASAATERPSNAPVPSPRPPTVPSRSRDDGSERVAIPAALYAALQTSRAVWLNAAPPRTAPPKRGPPPSVSTMPSVRPSVARRGNCLAYAPHGCRPGTYNPYAGQAFPTQLAKKDWTVIDTFEARAGGPAATSGELTSYGLHTCLEHTRTQWHEWCNSHPDEKGGGLHPIFSMFCVDDNRCFSDPDCVRNPDACEQRRDG